jgi:hypothetical protein
VALNLERSNPLPNGISLFNLAEKKNDASSGSL